VKSVTGRIVAALVFGLGGVAILLALGFWQVRRLEWKEAVLAEISARMEAPAGAVPLDATEARDEYLHVLVSGRLLPDEVHVYTSAPPFGVGYRVIAPLALDDGRTVLLDRGFVPIGEKDAPRLIGPIRVEGALLWPDETDSYTQAPDLAKNIWLARDLPAMAEALRAEPILIVTQASDDENAPMPLPVGVNIRNDHLQYAVTWFSLAAVWAMMTGYLIWRIKRRID
jgi:surfeit locus 1 family protein